MTSFIHSIPVADPGFPVGGRRPHRGGTNSRGGYVLKNLYVKMKESGPVGGHAPAAPPLDPPLYTESIQQLLILKEVL